ncbi:MAG: cysteine ABC transporter substrate-binding protein [Deltaproteobacteria bacterium]|nr:cysteine ABC transporter substrate-binding protein [Deltaproteobacteria bacterium]MBQ6669137.1 cysteine ABC transporter substrate-binding protein [Deltaproteobacteria bacterium]
MKKAVWAVLVAGLALIFAGSAMAKNDTGRTVEQIKKSKQIVIAVFSDKKPFGYVDENGEYQGYDVYFANRIAKDLGVKVKFVPVEPAARVEVLDTNKVDLVLANFTKTPERAQKVDFALPYMKVALGVVSKESALITAPEQLNGKTLIIVKGTTAETYFSENYPKVKLLKFEMYADAYKALLDGRGDAFSTDNTEVLAWAIENPGYKVGIESLGNLDTINPAIKKGNASLMKWLNEEIVKLGTENFFHADYEATLRAVYGAESDANSIVVEGGKI